MWGDVFFTLPPIPKTSKIAAARTVCVFTHHPPLPPRHSSCHPRLKRRLRPQASTLFCHASTSQSTWLRSVGPKNSDGEEARTESEGHRWQSERLGYQESHGVWVVFSPVSGEWARALRLPPFVGHPRHVTPGV